MGNSLRNVKEVIMEPLRGGEVKIGISKPEGLFNPIFYQNQYDRYPLNYAFEFLMIYDDQMELRVPVLAEKREYVNQNRELIIYLRKDVKWHDGMPFTSDDVIFTYETIAHPEYTGPRFYTVKTIKGAEEKKRGDSANISGLTKIDDHTLKLEFKEPHGAALLV